MSVSLVVAAASSLLYTSYVVDQFDTSTEEVLEDPETDPVTTLEGCEALPDAPLGP